MCKLRFIIVFVFALTAVAPALPESNHKKILRLFDAFNASSIAATSGLEKSEKGKLNDDTFRLWVIPVTDNNGYILIGRRVAPFKLRLYEFNKNKFNEVEANKIDIPLWLTSLTANPVEFPESQNSSATVQHILLYEEMNQDRYSWAVREFSNEPNSDFNRLREFFERVSEKPVDLGWIVPR